MARLVKERAVQALLMTNVHSLIQCVLSYGGHVSIENPTHSKLWKQPFMKAIESSILSKHKCRSFLLNRCMAGGIHFKQYKFLTSLPPEFTAHMGKVCDHRFKHPACLGRDANGKSVTKASGVYTMSMLSMMVSTIGLVAGSEKIISDASDGLHLIHENHRVECDVPFEDANDESYLAGVCTPQCQT